MEEPEGGTGESQPVVFQAVASNPNRDTSRQKKEPKGAGVKIRSRKATPRPVMKGNGRKRFGLSPSPRLLQIKKKASREDPEEDGKPSSKNKRNILRELNEVASPLCNSQADSTGDTVCAEAEGAGTSATHVAIEVASPLAASPEDDTKYTGSVGKEGEGTSTPPEKMSNPVGDVGLLEVNTDQMSEETAPISGQTLNMVVGRDGTNDLHSQPTSSETATVNGQMREQVEKPDGCSGSETDEGRLGVYGGELGRNEVEMSLAVHAATPPPFGKDTKCLLESNSTSTKKKEITGLQQVKESQDLVADVHRRGPPSDDMILDICAAQPLRRQSLTGSCGAENPGNSLLAEKDAGSARASGGLDCHSIGPGALTWKGSGLHVNVPREGFDADFPPLPTGRTMNIAKNFEKLTHTGIHGSGKWGMEKNGSELPQPVPTPLAESPGMTEPTKSTSGNLGGGPPGASATLAEVLKTAEAKLGEREPVTFQPNKMRKLGIVGLSDGRPAIIFSGEDAKYLADKMGYTIVGKFSHSIPSTGQIQKAFEKMRIVGEYSWKYINAKHVVIQVEDPDDYANLLIGQNGMPVWYVDHHPMRVFKWTPDFNPYFETPIASVWCNINGLPIHLFERSALFAIGKLLGNPIQLDYATATHTRLSFARICVEIDISKPPTEEFVLDILGKETVQRVVWDKIPLYCKECHHVGHISAKCYAFGKKDTTDNRKSNNDPRRYAFEKRQQHYREEGNGSYGEARKHHAEGNRGPSSSNPPGSETNPNRHAGSSFKWKEKNKQQHETEFAKEMDEEGFMKQGRRRGHKKSRNGMPRTSSTGDIHPPEDKRDVTRHSNSSLVIYDPGSSSHNSLVGSGRGGKRDEALLRFAKPSYFKQLENGEFETGVTDDEDEMEEDPGSLQLLYESVKSKGVIETKKPGNQPQLTLSVENGKEGQSASYSIRI